MLNNYLKWIFISARLNVQKLLYTKPRVYFYILNQESKSLIHKKANAIVPLILSYNFCEVYIFM